MKKFQSTPPSRVATAQADATASDIAISIHTTLAGGDNLPQHISRLGIWISIHTTLAGGDP